MLLFIMHPATRMGGKEECIYIFDTFVFFQVSNDFFLRILWLLQVILLFTISLYGYYGYYNLCVYLGNIYYVKI